MGGRFRPFFRGGAIYRFQCWFPHGVPFGVRFALLFDTIHFGGIEEVGSEFGETPMSANGTVESRESLGKIIRSAPVSREVTQAGMADAPQDTSVGRPAGGATEPASSTANRFYHSVTFSLPASAGLKFDRSFTFSLPEIDSWDGKTLPLRLPLLEKAEGGMEDILGRPGSSSLPIYVLRFPVVDLLMLFLGGNVVERNRELQWTGGLLDLALDVPRGGNQLRSGKRGQVAPGKFSFEAAKLFTENIDAVGSGREPLLAQRFEFDGMEVLDLELMFAAPGNECGFGDIEFDHEPGVGPALGTEFDETLDSLWRMHIRTIFPAEPVKDRPLRSGRDEISQADRWLTVTDFQRENKFTPTVSYPFPPGKAQRQFGSSDTTGPRTPSADAMNPVHG